MNVASIARRLRASRLRARITGRRGGDAGRPRPGWHAIQALTALLVAMAPIAVGTGTAFAEPGPAVTVQFPSSVTVGDTKVAGSLTITNTAASQASVDIVTLVPACGTSNFTADGDCPSGFADPDVFQLPANAFGGGNGACDGEVFDLGNVDAATGQVQFSPASPIILSPAGTENSTCVVDFTFSVIETPTKPAGSGPSGLQTDPIGFATEGSSDGTPRGGGGSTAVSVAKFAFALSGSTPNSTATLGSPIADSATLSPAAPVPPAQAPTGSISFSLYGPTDPTCVDAPVFTATTPASTATQYTSASYTPTEAGAYHWIASYPGDANYQATTTTCGAAGQTSTVSQTPQTISFTSVPPNPATVGQTYTVTANGGASGNSVVFTADPSSKSVCTVTGGRVVFTGVGMCVIDANQAGNTDYLAAPQAQQTVTVTRAPTTLVAARASRGLVITLSATLTRTTTGAALAGEPVSFSLFGHPVCAATTNSAGVASCKAIGLVLGPASYTARFAGDANNLPTTATGGF
jgi:hypothetical protein